METGMMTVCVNEPSAVESNHQHHMLCIFCIVIHRRLLRCQRKLTMSARLFKLRSVPMPSMSSSKVYHKCANGDGQFDWQNG